MSPLFQGVRICIKIGVLFHIRTLTLIQKCTSQDKVDMYQPSNTLTQYNVRKTVMLANTLNTSVEGFYYRDYLAVNTPGIIFRVLFKVGDPRVNGTYYHYSSTWADLLISYDVVTSGITSTTSYTYDDDGNPTTITNFNYKGVVYDEALLSWDGRSLKSITVRENNTTIATITYTYNDQGIRIKKVILENGVETVTDYYLSGNQVVLEKTNDCVMLYTYDVDGSLISFNYDNNEYFYVKDLLGNIIRIVDANGATLVEYQYDAYGNTLHVIDTSGFALSTINPYRYRSYRYDVEISYYYCNARYYQPLIGRWLNADDVRFLDSEGVGGLNLFGYCENNPVMYVDPEGNFPWLILAAILLFTPVGGIATQVATSIGSYAYMAVASIWDSDIRSDMNAIGWNPFNTEESATLNSNKVSFYKGVPVFRTSFGGRSGSFGAIFLTKGSVVDDLRHERGHNWQLMMMGIGTYGFTVGIPSPLKLGLWDKSGKYYYAPWETMADILGGVTHRYGMPIPQRQITNAWMYYGISTLCFPFTALYWL